MTMTNKTKTIRYRFIHKSNGEEGKPIHQVCMERTKGVLKDYARRLGLNLEVLYTPEELFAKPSMKDNDPDDRFVRITFEEVTREEIEEAEKNNVN